MQIILLHLHTLVAFTATNTWAITKLKHLEKLRIGMVQLCANIMGALFHKGYYLVLKVIHFVQSFKLMNNTMLQYNTIFNTDLFIINIIFCSHYYCEACVENV